MIFKKISNNLNNFNKLNSIKINNLLCNIKSNKLFNKFKNIIEIIPIFSLVSIIVAQIFYGWSLEGRRDLKWMHAHLGFFGLYIILSTILYVYGFISFGKLILQLTYEINDKNHYKKYDIYNLNNGGNNNGQQQKPQKNLKKIIKSLKFPIELKLYRNILLCIFLISLVISFFKLTKDKGATLINHGQYNLIAFTTIMLIYIVFFLTWYIFLRNWSIKHSIFTVILLLCVYISYSIKNVDVRQQWPLGLDGKQLMFIDETNEKVCKIDSNFIAWPQFFPKGTTKIITGSSECPSESEQFSRLINGILLMENCKDDIRQYTLTPQFWDDQKRFDSFTNDFKYFETKYQGVSLTLDYNGPVVITHETVMAICGNQTEIHYQNVRDPKYYQRTINNFNAPKIGQPLSAKVKLPNHPNEQYNKKPIDILFLMIDAISRAQFKSAMPSTFDTLQSIQNQGHSKVFQFFRYHSLKPYSDPNTMAMYNGYNRVEYDDIDIENGVNTGGVDKSEPFSWELNPMFYQSFRNDSYVTSWVTGLCQDWFQHYLKMDKEQGSIDHEMALPFCSPQLHPPEKPFGIFEGPYSIRRRCLGDKHVHETIFNYINQFWENYKDVGKILHTTLMDGHEGTNEVIQIADPNFSKFLDKDLRPKLNDTFLILASDHGQHMSGYYMWSKGGKIEVAMPMLYLVLPTWFLDKYPEVELRLLENENKLSTPFQLYDTIRTLSTFPEFGGIDMRDPNSIRSKNEKSKGFLGKIKEDISCLELGIPYDFCVCNKN